MPKRAFLDGASRDRTPDLLLAKSAQARVAMSRLRRKSSGAGDLARPGRSTRSYGDSGSVRPLPGRNPYARDTTALPTDARRGLESTSRPVRGGARTLRRDGERLREA